MGMISTTERAETAGTFAFLVHPRAAIAADLGRVWKPLGVVPEAACTWGLRRLPIPALPLATVHRQAGPAFGRVYVVPVGAQQMFTEPRRWVIGRIERAIDLAVEQGATVVGLGALTAPVTGGGRLLRPRPGVAFTTGNAFTAQLTVDGLRRLLPAARGGHVAIVGATGSVGSCVVRLLGQQPASDELTLIAREPKRLAALADEARAGSRQVGSRVDIRTSTSIMAARNADLVVVLTSAADALLGSEHLKFGAVVLDDTQPRNIDPRLAVDRPDLLVVDGGVASVPGLRIRGDIGLPPGLAYACLCETILMALDGQQDSAIGQASVEHARRLQAVARRYADLGFTLADPALSFGRPLPWPTALQTDSAGAVG